MFGEFGLEYLGPVDGHDIKSLLQILKVAKSHQGPVVVHVLTKREKGIRIAKGIKKASGMVSDPLIRKPASRSRPRRAGSLSWSSVISETLIRLEKENQEIVAVTPAMITGSKLEKFFAVYPERAFDCGIAEEHAATFCAGLAISGNGRSSRCIRHFAGCYDQINHDICRMDCRW